MHISKNISRWHLFVTCFTAHTNTCTHMMHRSCTVEHISPWYPTHFVPVLRVHFQFLHEVTCYLTVAFLGCPVQHGIPIISSVMDLHSKLQRQELYHFQVVTFCSQVQSIPATLPRDNMQDGKQSICTRILLKSLQVKRGTLRVYVYVLMCIWQMMSSLNKVCCETCKYSIRERVIL